MINELKKILCQEFVTEERDVVTIEQLQEQVRILNSKNAELELRLEQEKNKLNIALDEIVLNRQRIDSLLRQLGEKQGGKM